ncbi:MAG: bifunctional riboflavin kinase/FAD synthetase [candidate division KSB1 bacterium]|nr:bifunctional riboflavin kinase/FAD synthetase [candidate division KSB1 bacterium]
MAIRIYRELEKVAPDPRSVVTVGTFDGLHRGHQAIIQKLKQEAQKGGRHTTVVTFEPHPQLVLQRPDKPPVHILTTVEEKIALLREANLDRLVVIPFTLEFSRTSSEDFVRDILVRRIGMQAIVIGHDHGFGKNREGDIETLRKMGQALGFEVREVPPFEIDGVVISSTRVRQALAHGEVELAAYYLGRPYSLSGTVVRGEGRGQKLGFPTANLFPTHDSKLVPAEGVYAVWVERATSPRDVPSPQKHRGMMNIGYRPTFGNSVRVLETHLFDFSGELYGERLTVHFVARLRNEQKFDSAHELMAQLHRDRAASLQVLIA